MDKKYWIVERYVKETYQVVATTKIEAKKIPLLDPSKVEIIKEIIKPKP